MKTLKFLTLLLLALLISNCKHSKNQDNNVNQDNESAKVEEVVPKEASLYDRLGGADGISVIVDDIIQAHMENPIISSHFLPLQENEEYFELFKNHVKEFLASGTGGMEKYTGKEFSEIHKGMNITEKEFIAAVDDILGVLAEHNIDEKTKREMLYILYSMKGAVIGV